MVFVLTELRMRAETFNWTELISYRKGLGIIHDIYLASEQTVQYQWEFDGPYVKQKLSDSYSCTVYSIMIVDANVIENKTATKIK